MARRETEAALLAMYGEDPTQSSTNELYEAVRCNYIRICLNASHWDTRCPGEHEGGVMYSEDPRSMSGSPTSVVP